MKLKGKRIISLILCIVVVISIINWNNFSSKASTDAIDNTSAEERLEQTREEFYKEEKNNKSVKVIVELEEEAIVEKVECTDELEYNEQLKNKEKKIINEQDRIIEKVESITSTKVINRMSYLMNAFSIETTRDNI